MAKNLKLNIKNTQLAQALNLGSLKSKLAESKAKAKEKVEEEERVESTPAQTPSLEDEPKRTVRARDKTPKVEESTPEMELQEPASLEEPLIPPPQESTEEEEIFFEEPEVNEEERVEEPSLVTSETEEVETPTEIFPEAILEETLPVIAASTEGFITQEEVLPLAPKNQEVPVKERKEEIKTPVFQTPEVRVKLGPTGRHVKDLLKPKPPAPPARPTAPAPAKEERRGGVARAKQAEETQPSSEKRPAARQPATEIVKESGAEKETVPSSGEEAPLTKKVKSKEFSEVKPLRKAGGMRGFDARDRQGLRGESEEDQWRKKRPSKHARAQLEDSTIRPTSLKIRLPISIKDLAVEMKLKASQLISKLFMQGAILTLNDILDDETAIQLLGQEFGCTIEIDTAEEERIRITTKNIREEIQATDPSLLSHRAPIVTFMGHVDHGKTSLIDAIRKSNRVAHEAGAITQHIGAFRCSTPVGDLTILDTPGHEAFSAMRTRGAEVTDIVVLVIAGDEGMRQQTIEAMNQAKEAGVTIVVAINKCDKPNFNAETVYQQLASHELLPEAWGGATITVNCSATTGQGVPELLEMLALQAEVLELKANPTARARGTVLESELHKGLGPVATVLVQNGTLHLGDAIVFGQLWGRVKTMYNEHGTLIQEAGPSAPVEITGLSGLPEAGQGFIVVKNEKEAREIATAREEGHRRLSLQHKKKISLESLQQAAVNQKKTLNIILKADVQGSLEALKTSLLNIKTSKVDLNIISTSVGEVSESDIQLAAASQAVILGFHTQIESHAENIIKQTGVKVYLHDIIYHAIDDVKRIMVELLDKIPQEREMATVEVRATFKASQVGVIAGCQVLDGTIARNHKVRVLRNNQIIWQGNISSLKRIKDDVREVKKGFECGILLDHFNEIAVGDIIQSYEIYYLTQEL